MHKFIFPLWLILLLFSCSDKENAAKVHYPSEAYEYVKLKNPNAVNSDTIYVPIYSHVYLLDGTRPYNLGATLSLRSISLKDSTFITNVDYYNSQGVKVKSYLKNILLLKPMHSAEFVVEQGNTEGGAGAYFLIYASHPNANPNLLVQAVMVSQAANLGISFKTEGVLLR